jgi:hypothetical protein
MKNKRIAYGLILLVCAVAAFFLYKAVRKKAIEWYASTHMERQTPFPSSANPDQICLTWSGDPKTSATVQWRTAITTLDGEAQFHEKSDAASSEVVPAVASGLSDRLLVNDPDTRRFTAELAGLKPGTAYSYRVGSPKANVWSAWSEFTTAPAEAVPFSFVYLGDPQLGLDYWGKLVHASFERNPNAAFYLIAGDLVNNGTYRNEWDEFFKAGEGVFDRRPVLPVLGNHDYAKQDTPALYLALFGLPVSGPGDAFREKAYSLRYSNALFVVLDSNLSAKEQAPWLETQLADTSPVWKFVSYHHPAYSSKANRDNPDVRDVWGPLFDKYHVDVALQGHDHAYLRTYPMFAGKRADSAAKGTYYTVTVSGTKYYEQEPHDYAACAFPNISTYQVIDITTNPNRLSYRAFDLEGKMLDEFSIEK